MGPTTLTPTRRRVVAAAAAATLLGALLAGCAATPTREPESAPSAAAAQPTPAPGAAAPDTAGPASAVNPAARADAVPVAPPTHLAFPAASIDGAVEEYTTVDAAANNGIDPPTLESISWYSGIDDGMPGSDATNTVYLFGHSWTRPAVFNGLRDVRVGDQATVTTASGILTYQVTETMTMAKSDFTDDARVAAAVPGRLALVSCFRPEGWDPDERAPENIVVMLHLVGAQPLSP